MLDQRNPEGVKLAEQSDVGHRRTGTEPESVRRRACVELRRPCVGARAPATGALGVCDPPVQLRVAVRTGDLSVAYHGLIGSRVDALGLSPDGTTLFVLLHDGGRIAALDAATAAVLGFVPGGGFDRLLAVAPW